MKLALMQPYFVPYIGYYSLLKNVDVYYYLDEVQYINQGWIDRNRMLKPDQGWQYIRVPLIKHSSNIIIKDIRINNSIKWKQKILRQLDHYKKNAKYYKETIELLNRVFEKDFDYLIDFLYYLDGEVCEYLGISTPRIILSRAKLNFLTPAAPDEWGLNVCKAIEGIDEYWNAIGGKAFFNNEKYFSGGIELYFLRANLTDYQQKDNKFISGLSILDVMMFNSKDEINSMLDDFKIEVL